jgi:hypothetical protein
MVASKMFLVYPQHIPCLSAGRNVPRAPSSILVELKGARGLGSGMKILQVAF